MTRLFGSLKQLNRSASLQRRIFQREVKEREKVRAPAGGSLEIIHNVDEVFRTQETFDMQRICELKSQLQSSQSDQHIYGRVREPEREQRKKPRISRVRLLQIEQEHDLDQDQESVEVASLYLNESVCQWMTSLRSQVHHYDEGAWQQPKSVPASYQREREWMQQDEEEKENVILRRTKEDKDQLDPVDNFKRKLRLKREPKERPEEQRRCAVTPDLVSEFLSNRHEDEKEREELQIARVLPPTATIHSLWQLMQAIVFSSSLHVCVRGFLTSYDKSLAQWLFLQQQHQQQQRQQHRRHHSTIAMRAYRKRAGKRASAKRVDRESAGEELVLRLVAPSTPDSDDVSPELRRRKRSEEIGVKTGAEVAGPVIESDNNGDVKKNNNSEDSRSNSNKKNNSVRGGRALMAAPKTNGEAERPNNNNNHNNNNANSSTSDDNESSSSSTNNNNNNNTGNCNVSEQQQQQQQITQVNTY